MKNQIRRREFITLLGGARPPLAIGRKIGPSVILAVVIQTLGCPLCVYGSLFGSRFLCHNRINFVSRYETH